LPDHQIFKKSVIKRLATPQPNLCSRMIAIANKRCSAPKHF